MCTATSDNQLNQFNQMLVDGLLQSIHAIFIIIVFVPTSRRSAHCGTMMGDGPMGPRSGGGSVTSVVPGWDGERRA